MCVAIICFAPTSSSWHLSDGRARACVFSMFNIRFLLLIHLWETTKSDAFSISRAFAVCKSTSDCLNTNGSFENFTENCCDFVNLLLRSRLNTRKQRGKKNKNDRWGYFEKKTKTNSMTGNFDDSRRSELECPHRRTTTKPQNQIGFFLTHSYECYLRQKKMQTEAWNVVIMIDCVEKLQQQKSEENIIISQLPLNNNYYYCRYQLLNFQLTCAMGMCDVNVLWRISFSRLGAQLMTLKYHSKGECGKRDFFFFQNSNRCISFYQFFVWIRVKGAVQQTISNFRRTFWVSNDHSCLHMNIFCREMTNW